MCDTGNLIDLTGWDEPLKDETVIEKTSESTSFKGPYDPFDSMEKEACIKGMHFKDQIKAEKLDIKTDIRLDFSDQDLNNETPPVAMDFEPTNADGFKTESNHSQKLQKQVVQLNALRIQSSTNTPPNHPSTKFSRNAILTENLKLIAAESPIKLIEDEPNPIQYSPAPTSTSTSSTSNLSDDTCSNTEFEARLKMVRIAMLGTHVSTKEPNPNLESNVGKLLQDLKSLIWEHVPESKRKALDILIESISAAAHSNVQSPSTTKDADSLTTDSPTLAYKRQATFDLDLELNKKKTIDSPEHVIGAKVQEFPDAMTCSSATFDGESLATDRPAIPIPIIDTESPKISDEKLSPRPKQYVTGVVNDNLALQINELLEQHNLTKLQMNDTDQHNYESNVGGGQTVILVVNSTGGNNQLPSCVVHPSTTRTSKIAATNSNSNKASTMRRRSSSLSIHDKSKPERPRALVKQSSGDGSVVNTTANQCMPLKELSVVGDNKFNAMSSYRQRRNSFNVGLTGKAGATASAIAQSRALLSGRNKASPISENKISSKPDVIPIKRVAPMVKPLNMSTTDVKHLNSTMPRSVGQETPMPSRSKPGSKLFCTSTPMPQMRSQPNRSLRPVSSYSNSCASTPNVRASMGGYTKKAAQ